MKIGRRALGIGGLWLLAAVGVWAAPPSQKATPPLAKPGAPQIPDNSQVIDINNLLMWVTNHGSFAWDIQSGDAGLQFPKPAPGQPPKTVVFASGLWVGGKVRDTIRVALGEYSQEYVPGPMAQPCTPAGLDGPGCFLPDNANFRVFKVLRNNPTALDWPNWIIAARQGAPFVGTDSNTPAVLGDQMLWAVYNDASPAIHTNTAGSSKPLGIEVQQTTFAFNRTGALGQTIFLKFKVINKGQNTIDSCYLSLWADPDLGGFTDDLVGCDTTLSLGFCYNATNTDEQYGSTPPSVGYDFFQGPIGDLGQRLPMTSFNKYINGTDPASKDETYNYMKGLQPDGSPLINEVTGDTTTFFVSGDPVAGTGWLDNAPADRRMQLTSGPFTFAPGDTQEVVAAIIVGQGGDRLSSITVLKFFDKSAQKAFDLNFVLPSPPDAPAVTVHRLDSKIQLTWTDRSEIQHGDLPFQGYNIYQTRSLIKPDWKLIAVQDVNDGLGLVFDDVLDPVTNVVVNKPVAFGSDAGVSHFIDISQDKVLGGPLHNGTPYYFAVTAYSADPNQAPTFRVLETALNPIVAIPEGPVAGSDLTPAKVDTAVIYSRINPALSPSTDVVTAEVFNPEEVTGHTYEVRFHPNQIVSIDSSVVPPETTFQVIPFQNSNGKSVYVTELWDLWDLNTNTAVLTNRWNKAGDNNYDVVGGILVKVQGAYKAELQDVFHVNTGAHRRAWSGVNAGLQFFFNSADYANNFFCSKYDPAVSTNPFTTVQIIFYPNDTARWQYAYNYRRDVVGPNNYRNIGYFRVPFQVWDVVNNLQLNAAFIENARPPVDGNLDSLWDPTDSTTGGREYVFVFRSTYSPTPDTFYLNHNINSECDIFDMLYAWWPLKRSATDTVDNGDYLEFLFANPSTANDRYTIRTTAPVLTNAGLAKGQLSRVKAVPNPYFNRSAYELTQFDRQIKFTNLPTTCTIKIYNLAGELVRTLQKTDPSTSQLTWDILSEARLPIASGIYLWRLEAPGIGEAQGKMVIFTEQEQLNNF